MLSDAEGAQYLRHRLRTVGLRTSDLDVRFDVLQRPGAVDLRRWVGSRNAPQVLLAVSPQRDFLESLGLSEAGHVPRGAVLQNSKDSPAQLLPVRAVTGGRTFASQDSHPAVVTYLGSAVWLVCRVGEHAIIVAGTSVIEDLVLLAQGDPNMEGNAPLEPMWGIAGERPNYLFSELRSHVPKDERVADNWLLLLRELLSKEGFKPDSVLPQGAPGAIVLTGDDDQAELEKYFLQRELLKGLPVTYLLHPLTRHSKATMSAMSEFGPTEFGLHPDALAQPNRYDEILREQSAWFAEKVGARPRVLRNHGFLNAGYWGHSAAWRSEGILGSSNLPGFDGDLLNSSLLPARLLINTELMSHWSVLTAFGDGMIFAGGYTDFEASERMLELASSVYNHPIPGIIVLNLHPQNVEQTSQMHRAARQIVDGGFVALSLGECLAWFSRPEGLDVPVVSCDLGPESGRTDGASGSGPS